MKRIYNDMADAKAMLESIARQMGAEYDLKNITNLLLDELALLRATLKNAKLVGSEEKV